MAKTLRILTAAGFTTKGSQLTMEELDQNFIDLQSSIETNASTIAALPIHAPNEDQYLDLGGANQVSAAELKPLVDAGAPTFIGLPDTPADYSGFEGYSAVVNAAEDGIGFTKLTSSLSQWEFDTNLTPEPAVTDFRMNDVTMEATNELYLSGVTESGFDATEYFAEIGAGDIFRFFQVDNAGVHAEFDVQGPAVGVGSTFTIPVLYKSGTGGPLTNNKIYQFSRTPAASVQAAMYPIVEDFSGNEGKTIVVNEAGNGFEFADPNGINGYGYVEGNTNVTTINSTGVFEEANVSISPIVASFGILFSGSEAQNISGKDLDLELFVSVGIGSEGANSDRFIIQCFKGATPIKGRCITTSSNTEDGGASFITALTLADTESVTIKIANADNGSNVTIKELTIKINER